MLGDLFPVQPLRRKDADFCLCLNVLELTVRYILFLDPSHTCSQYHREFVSLSLAKITPLACYSDACLSTLGVEVERSNYMLNQNTSEK